MRAFLPMRRALGIATVLAALGCGRESKPDRPEVVAAGGIVTYKGEPVEGATVTFRPKQEGYSAHGKTDAEGRFRLQTFEVDDGALPGEHIVTVEKYERDADRPEDESDWNPDNPAPTPPPKYALPKKYTLPTTSGLNATVTAGEENNFTFDLEE